MRLHRLTLTAFGPFPGTESIDFDALSEAGLFLLRGETGAGKSSLLDAVCFGLYGQLPGARGTAGAEKRVRSDYAAEDVAPEVEVEFSVRGRRLRITRTPAWDRPKKRGTGTTTAQAKSLLAEFVDGEWMPLSSRNDEVGQLVGGVLGMDVHQFTRVAMLPQGEFAAFLRATDSDREKLLKRLFDTRLFDRSVASAAERAKALAAQAGQAKGRREAIVAEVARRIAPVLGDPAEAPAAAPQAVPTTLHQEEPEGRAEQPALAGEAEPMEAADPPASLRRGEPAWFAAIDQRALQHAAVLSAAGETARAALADARALHDAAKQAMSDEAVLRDWRQRQLLQEQGAEAAAAEGKRLALHRRALTVRSEMDAEQQAREALRRAEESTALAVAAAVEDLEASRATVEAEGHPAREWEAWLLAAQDTAKEPGEAQLAGHGAPDLEGPDGLGPEGSGPRGANPDRWQAAVEAAAESAAQALQTEQAAAGASAARQAAERHATALAHKETAARAALEKARGAQAKADAEVVQAPAPKSDPETLLDAVAREEALVLAAAESERAQAALDAQTLAHATATAAAVDASNAALDVRKRQAESMSKILAATLQAGESCPVCGSEEHPHPAAAEESELQAVSKEAVEAADRQSEHAATAAREAGTLVAAASERRLSAHAAAKGLDVASATASLDSARAAHDAAVKEKAAHLAAQASLGVATAAVIEAGAALESLVEQRAAADAALLAAGEAQTDALARLAVAIGPFASVTERRGAISAWGAQVKAVQSALTRRAEATSALQKAALRAAAVLSSSQLDAEQASTVLLPAAEANELEQRVSERAMETARLAELASSEAVVRAKDRLAREQAIPDEEALSALRDNVLELDASSQEATAAAGVAAALRLSLAGEREQVEQIDAALGPVLRKAQVAGDIAELLAGNGENRLNMSLPIYVLAARLEAVAEAATHRLDAMSDGRFRLVHVDAKRGNRRGGLGLAVEDAWTGVRRAPETLSGGETFMASLALALGLADVVQEESGGVDVETLFVDEGFGTLDAETLELVLNGLDQLRQGGRLVGVVSHVAELGQRIGAQVEVTKSRKGSTARIVGVGEQALGLQASAT